MKYRANPDSLASHDTPAWWRDAKLGVMVTWGLYSVPAFAPRGVDVVKLLMDRPDDALKLTPYAEWYENSLKFPDGPTAEFHQEHFGAAPYTAFQGSFESTLGSWSADPLMDFVAEIGARYVVPITKHCDSYCLWPTALANPLRGPAWHSPRNLVSEMAKAARARSLRFGVYYCAGLDWSLRPEPIANLAQMRATLPTGPAARKMMFGHYQELIAATDPDILWNDIGYPDLDDLWRLLAGYYNDREDRLVNDRFQVPAVDEAFINDAQAQQAYNRAISDALRTPGFAFAPDVPAVFDHRTPEYAVSSDMGDIAWETVRGVGHSFGYKANETEDDFLTGDELIAMFLRIVGTGGNLLINIGPRADGSIPDNQATPLRALGKFLKAHGDAIYGSRPANWLPVAASGVSTIHPVEVGKKLYGLVSGPLGRETRLKGWAPIQGIAMHGGGRLSCVRDGEDLCIALPPGVDLATATVLELFQ